MIISVSKCCVQENPEDTHSQRNLSLEGANKTTNTSGCFPYFHLDLPLPQNLKTSPDAK